MNIIYPKKLVVHFASAMALVVGFSFPAFSAMPVKCDPSNSTTIDRINACISQDHMNSILMKFQNISDSNPDNTFLLFKSPTAKTAPGSRDAGTPGDRASVDYISKYMRGLGYTVTVQSYPVSYTADRVLPIMEEVSPIAFSFIPGQDFSTATYSHAGDVTAHLQSILPSAPVEGGSSLGCNASDFAGFTPGNIALMQRGTCGNRQKVLNAIAAGAVGAITINVADTNSGNTLLSPDGITVPVFAYIPLSVGQKLYSDTGGTLGTQLVHMRADLIAETRTTYNVIADSPYGNTNSVVVLGGHYDSLYGAGILDNASGVASMMEIAAALKNTKTTNHLRFGFWGAEEEHILGSAYYLDTLSAADLSKIAYNLDFDDTATKNYVLNISDPSYANANPSGFPVVDQDLWVPAAVTKSALAVNLFKNYMDSVGMPYEFRLSDVAITSSDDHNFLTHGIPVSSLITGQSFPKTPQEVALFGGSTAPMDVCGDTPYVFCDNLSNINPAIMTPVTKAFAAVAVQLLFNPNLNQ